MVKGLTATDSAKNRPSGAMSRAGPWHLPTHGQQKSGHITSINNSKKTTIASQQGGEVLLGCPCGDQCFATSKQRSPSTTSCSRRLVTSTSVVTIGHVACEAHFPFDPDPFAPIRTSAHTITADLSWSIHIFITYTTNYKELATPPDRNS